MIAVSPQLAKPQGIRRKAEPAAPRDHALVEPLSERERTLLEQLRAALWGSEEDSSKPS